MAKLEYACPQCGRSGLQSEIPMSGGYVTHVYRCGHIETLKGVNGAGSPLPASSIYDPTDNALDPVPAPVDDTFKSLDFEFTAYDFQIEGVKFIEESGFNCVIADATGLGKTIQSLIAIKRNKATTLPVLVIVKGSITFQWARQTQKWAEDLPLKIMPLLTRANFIPGFDFYFISRDLLGRKGILDLLNNLTFKLLVIDECHNFKDPSSLRTRSLIKLLTQSKIYQKICLSATPIKNRADEYFTVLNLVAPHIFRSRDAFRREWLVQDEKGRWSRINPYRLEAFRQLTNKYILRREKRDVLKNLPPLTRNYEYIEIEDDAIKTSYNKQLDLFSNFLSNKANITSQEILGWLARLRSLTGQAKCQGAIDWAQEFLDSTDESLAIGIQHTSVRDTLYYIFKGAGYDPLKLSGEDNIYQKDRVIRAFNEGKNRLLIINMIAGGEGVDLQHNCANMVVLERQWTSADEEQFEGRIERDGQKNACTITYLIAKGTIDDFFHEMVERKRKILGETLSGWDLTQDTESLMEFSQTIIANKL